MKSRREGAIDGKRKREMDGNGRERKATGTKGKKNNCKEIWMKIEGYKKSRNER